eukprot:9235431-Pyramimonas_sp.AAC.1
MIGLEGDDDDDDADPLMEDEEVPEGAKEKQKRFLDDVYSMVASTLSIVPEDKRDLRAIKDS